MDQGALIDLVRQYSHLYDKRHNEFKNKMAKQNAWTTIASIMGFSREEVETAWTSLRNRFVTERRKIRCTPTGSAATTEWRFFQQMSFLEQHVAVRKTLGNMDQNSSNICTEEIESGEEVSQVSEIVESQHDTIDDSQLLSTPSTSTQPAPVISSQTPASHKENIYEMKKLKKRKNDSSTLERSIVSTLETMETILKGSDNAIVEDEDLLFGRSIGSSLKLMKNRKTKARAKLEICQVLEKYEDSD